MPAGPIGDPAKASPVPTSRLLQREALDAFGARAAIVNCLYGGQAVHSEDLAQTLCRAVNDWIAAEWLDRDPRLRASIVVPAQNPHYAAEEIELRGRGHAVRAGAAACDERDAARAPLLLADLRGRGAGMICRSASMPAVHSGMRRPRLVGRRTIVQDYVGQSMGFRSAIAQPDGRRRVQSLPIVADRAYRVRCHLAAGVPVACDQVLARAAQRDAVVHPFAGELVRQHVRMTMQPFDAPTAAEVERIMEHIDSDELLLFATDFPHWHFDGR